jgi:hypothetical protein
VGFYLYIQKHAYIHIYKAKRVVKMVDLYSDSSDADELVMMDSEVETDSEDEFDIADELEYEIDNIYREDDFHMESTKIDQTYYIGLCNTYLSRNTILFVNSISNRSFFRHPYQNVLTYLKEYSIFHCSHPKIEIMKLNILPNGTYSALVKTHWLRLIQRHWKKVFARRKLIFRKRRLPGSQLYNQCHGKYPSDLRYLPTIHGMLSNYAT